MVAVVVTGVVVVICASCSKDIGWLACWFVGLFVGSLLVFVEGVALVFLYSSSSSQCKAKARAKAHSLARNRWGARSLGKAVGEERWGEEGPGVEEVAHPRAGDLEPGVEVRAANRDKGVWRRRGAGVGGHVDREEGRNVLRGKEEDDVEEHIAVFRAGPFLSK